MNIADGFFQRGGGDDDQVFIDRLQDGAKGFADQGLVIDQEYILSVHFSLLLPSAGTELVPVSG